jgi:hypothetical protein
MPVWVPPRTEQRRIVAKLDAIFDRTRAAKARLKRLHTLLDKLRRSILAAAFRGDLTADWRAIHPDAGVEPSSALFKRIRAERRRQWEASVSAKGKDLRRVKYSEAPRVVDEEDLPPLPNGWTWTTVGEFSVFVTDGEHATRAQHRGSRDCQRSSLGKSRHLAFWQPEAGRAVRKTLSRNRRRFHRGDLVATRSKADVVGMK